jgi:hypothetical protein
LLQLDPGDPLLKLSEAIPWELFDDDVCKTLLAGSRRTCDRGYRGKKIVNGTEIRLMEVYIIMGLVQAFINLKN